MAKRSSAIAASFVMSTALSVIVLEDESGYEVRAKTKLVVIDVEQNTKPPPAPFTLFVLSNQEDRTNHFAVQILYTLGIIAIRSTDHHVTVLKNLMT